MVSSFRDLRIYQESYEVTKRIYRIARKFPKEETYALTSQIRRAATSIPLNIAEGYAKNDSAAELKRFLKMAMGSCAEVEVLVDMARDLGYIEDAEHDELISVYEKVGKQINAFMRKIR